MRRPYLIGIAGGSGSGKTWLSRQIAAAFPGQTTVISVDWYYKDLATLPRETAERTNFDHPDSIESALLAAQLDELLAGREVAAPDYDFANFTRLTNQRRLLPKPLIVVEGIFALSYPGETPPYNDSVFIDVPELIRRERRLARDQAERGYTREQILRMWTENTQPMHLAHAKTARASARRIWDPAADRAFVPLFLADLHDCLARNAKNSSNPI